MSSILESELSSLYFLYIWLGKSEVVFHGIMNMFYWLRISCCVILQLHFVVTVQHNNLTIMFFINSTYMVTGFDLKR